VSAESSSKKAVVATLLGNAAVAALKFAVGALAGSSAMVSEAIHSSVDTGNQGLFLVGMSRSRKPADSLHPFGYGKELYFWSLIVAVSIFGLGGGLSIYDGIVHLSETTPPELRWTLLVLAGSAVFEGAAFAVSYREFRRSGSHGDQSAWRILREGKDPSLYTAVAENALDLAGLAVAAIAILLANLLDAAWIDGAGSIVIGVMLAAGALLLAYEARDLIVGEGVSPEVSHELSELAATDPAVRRARPPLTMYLGPENVMVAFELEFEPGTKSGEIADAVQRIEAAVRDRYPRVGEVLIEASAPEAARAADPDAGGDPGA
jgi:cation diffusion facilitator family transporter